MKSGQIRLKQANKHDWDQNVFCSEHILVYHQLCDYKSSFYNINRAYSKVNLITTVVIRQVNCQNLIATDHDYILMQLVHFPAHLKLFVLTNDKDKLQQ